MRVDGLRTEDVCATFIKPRTTVEKSLCYELAISDQYRVGRATWFISHSWQYRFLDLVDAVERFFHDQNVSDPIIWIDIFSLPQHGRADVEASWLKEMFTKAISRMEGVVMVMSPWNNPSTLTRAWCVFELWVGTTESTFNIAIPPAESEFFAMSVIGDMEFFASTIRSINSENCTATKLKDLTAIRQAIRETIGFPALDRQVRRVLIEWMVKSHQTDNLEGRNDLQRLERLFRLGTLCYEEGMGGHAEQLLEECYKRRKEMLGEDFTDTLQTAFCLGKLYSGQNSVKAEGIFVDVVERRRRTLGDWHPDTVDSVSELAGLYANRGEYGKTRPLYETCLEGRRRMLGFDSVPELGSATLTGEGVPEGVAGADWKKLAEEALRADHPTAITFATDVAGLCESQGDNSDAERLLKKCLKSLIHTVGDETTEALFAHHRLATFYQRAGRLEEAELASELTLAKARRLLGDEHFVTGEMLRNLTDMYEKRGMTEDALSLSFDHRQKPLTVEDPRAVHVMDDLAELYSRQGRYEQAEPLYIDALERRRRLLGEDHPDTLKSWTGLAQAYAKQGKYEESMARHREFYERSKRVLGEDHSITLRWVNDMGCLAHLKGDYDLAEPLLIDCLERRRRNLGKDQPDSLITAQNLALLYIDQGRVEEGEALFNDILKRRRRMFGGDHPQTLEVISELAQLYARRKQWGKAEWLSLQCVEAARRTLGDSHPQTVQYVSNADRLRREKERCENVALENTNRRGRRGDVGDRDTPKCAMM
ncbi:hypothetical protein HDV00_004053 [Rhizophlyctis rosea]|nr:hypothetical protein HDV00_004053 [Rhizophlyctis rosea]